MSMKLSVLRSTVLAVVGALAWVGGTAAPAGASERCVGTAVKRCVEIYWDTASDTYQARASITDTAGGGNYAVKVSRLQMLRTTPSNPDGTVMDTYSANDYDGWFWTEDTARGQRFDPCRWPNSGFRAKAYFEWKGDSQGSDWVYLWPHGHDC
jgi:hypothetical protein